MCMYARHLQAGMVVVVVAGWLVVGWEAETGRVVGVEVVVGEVEE